MSDRLLKELDVLKAIDRRIEELSKDPIFIRKNGIIDIMGVKKHILAIPSADRPQGKWIEDPEGNWDDTDRGEYECSSCGFRMYPYISDEAFREKYKFCPNCGAKMKGVDDDNI